MKRNKSGSSATAELVRRLLKRDSLKMADERLTLTEEFPEEMIEAVAKEGVPPLLSKLSGVDQNWIFYKEQPRVTFLDGDSDRTVYIQAGDNDVIPIFQDPTSIIKKLWESRLNAY